MKKVFTGAVFVVGLILSGVFMLPSCKHDTLNLSQFDKVCFDRDILPVFQNGCAITNCHSSGREMSLDAYPGIRREVTPGSPAQSRLYQAMTATLNQPMPPNHAIAEADRIKVRLWIEQGAKDSTCLSQPVLNPNVTGGAK